jgi:hypothetical protein
LRTQENIVPKTRSIRTAWLAGGSLFAVAMLGYGSTQTVGLLAHQRRHAHTVISTPVRAMDVSSGAGRLRIQATTDPNITIDASISDGLFSPTHHESVQGDVLVIRSSCVPTFNTFCTVNYTIRVPQGLSIKARSSGDAISVTGLNGDLDLSSSGGGVRVNGGGGRMHLSSSGGPINATGISSDTVSTNSSGGGIHVSFAQPPSNVSASSSGGAVTIDLPNTGDAYHVQASSSGGSTHTDVRIDPTSPRLVKAHSSGGGVRVRYSTTP